MTIAEEHIGLPSQTTVMTLTDLGLESILTQLADHEARITVLETLITSFGSTFRAGSKDVVAGLQPVSFPEVPTVNYTPWAMVITAEGNISIPVIQVPPLTDLRTETEFWLDVQEAGKLYWAINSTVSVSGAFRSGSQSVSAGTEPISFAALPSAAYTAFVIVITAEGNLSIPVQQVPPLTDTRTTTGFNVVVQEAGTMYWVVLYGTPTRNGSYVVSSTGIKTITFSDCGSATFIPVVYQITESGNLTIPVPQLPPLGDSRTTTSFDVDAQELGVIQWEF